MKVAAEGIVLNIGEVVLTETASIGDVEALLKRMAASQYLTDG